MTEPTIKEKILSKLEEFNKIQGVVFMNEGDAEDYFRGMTMLVEYFYVCGRKDSLKEFVEEAKK